MDGAVLHHVNLAVADLERSRRFYGELIGLAEVERPPFDVPGAWFDLGGGQLHLSVLEVSSPGRVGIDDRESHFAIRVPSFAAALELLHARGYSEDADPADPRLLRVHPRTIAGIGQIFVRDPDGYVVELSAEVP